MNLETIILTLVIYWAVYMNMIEGRYGCTERAYAIKRLRNITSLLARGSTLTGSLDEFGIRGVYQQIVCGQHYTMAVCQFPLHFLQKKIKPFIFSFPGHLCLKGLSSTASVSKRKTSPSPLLRSLSEDFKAPSL